MSFGSSYQEADYNSSMFKAGVWDCTITSASLKMSSTNKEMCEMEFSIPNQGKLRYWLVDDQSSQEAHDRTNANMTRFFDCFKIRHGNFSINQWVGRKGKIEIAQGKPNSEGKQYFEIKKLIVENQNVTNQNQQNAYQQNQVPYGNTQQPYQQQQTQPNSAYQPRNNPPQNNGYVPQENMDNIPF